MPATNGPRYFVSISFPVNLLGNYPNYSYFLHSSHDNENCIGDCWAVNNFVLNTHMRCSGAETNLMNTLQ